MKKLAITLFSIVFSSVCIGVAVSDANIHMAAIFCGMLFFKHICYVQYSCVQHNEAYR